MSRRTRGAIVLLAALVVLVLVSVLARWWPDGDDGASPPIPTPTATGSPTPTSTPTSPPDPTATACPEPERIGRLRVLSFNIHAARGRSGYDLQRITDEIRAWEADVVLLQEVDRHRPRTGYDDQPALLAARLGMNVVFGSNLVRRQPANGRPRPEYGTAILSRLPIRSWSNTSLPNRPGLERRGLLHATLVMDGQPIDVYTTHLQHTRGNIRVVQMRAIRRMLAADPRPRLLGGDLNATPDSPALAVALGLLQDSWAPGEGVGDGSGLTVPDRVPRRRIDYVLHDDSFVATGAETLVSAVSDHRALRVVLDVLGPSPCR